MNDRRGHRPVPVITIFAVLLALSAVLGACGQTAPLATPLPVATESPSATSAPFPTPTAAVTASPTQVAVTPACATADLKASHGLVEGAAGSRLTEVLLVAAVPCSVSAYPALGLRDGNGMAIVGSASAGPGRIDLVPGTPYTTVVRVSNWCSPEPAYPVQLELRVGAAEVPVTGSSFPLEGDLPPCNGPTDTNPILDGGAWAPPG